MRRRRRAGAVPGHEPRVIRSGHAQLAELTIERAVFGGLGLSRLEGEVIFVPRALPGERVRGLVVERKKGFGRATVAEWLERSPDRRETPCPFFSRCGGCAYQDTTYEAQGRLKVAVLLESLARSRVPFEGDVPLAPSPEAGWRSRASLHVDDRFGAARLGFYAEGSHRVVEVDPCLQLSDEMNRSVSSLRRTLAENAALGHAVKRIDIAESYGGEARVAVLHVDASSPQPSASAFAGCGLTGVVSAMGRSLDSVLGEPFVTHVVGQRSLRAHGTSFFQANRFVTPALVDHVSREVPPGAVVADLYSGIGLFAASLVPSAARVIAVESHPVAVADAVANAHGLDNVEIHEGDVGAALRAGLISDAGLVVLDPPRSGAGIEVMRDIAASRAETVVYVSCDPPTLGRDLRELLQRGFTLRSLHAFDMFPDTSHVEAVAVAQR